MMAKKPTEMVTKALKGMLPKSKLGRAILKNVFIYEEGTWFVFVGTTPSPCPPPPNSEWNEQRKQPLIGTAYGKR